MKLSGRGVAASTGFVVLCLMVGVVTHSFATSADPSEGRPQSGESVLPGAPALTDRANLPRPIAFTKLPEGFQAGNVYVDRVVGPDKQVAQTARVAKLTNMSGNRPMVITVRRGLTNAEADSSWGFSHQDVTVKGVKGQLFHNIPSSEGGLWILQWQESDGAWVQLIGRGLPSTNPLLEAAEGLQ